MSRLLDHITQSVNLAGRVYRVLSGHWDMFDSKGRKLFTFDTFFSLDSLADARVTQAPVENGTFASYNKTVSPMRTTVVLGYTGLALIRAAILRRCESLLKGTELVSIVTPDKTFVNMSVVAVDHSYTAVNGVDRLMLALTLEEVRQVQPAYATEKLLSKGNVKNSADASTVAVGKQQGRAPRTSTLERARQEVSSWL